MVRILSRRELLKYMGGVSVALAVPGILTAQDTTAAAAEPPEGTLSPAQSATYLALAVAVTATKDSPDRANADDVSWRASAFHDWHRTAIPEDRAYATDVLDWLQERDGWSEGDPEADLERLRALSDTDDQARDRVTRAVQLVRAPLFVGGESDHDALLGAI